MEGFTSEELEVAQLPEKPGIYWDKKSPAADWEPTEVAEGDGRLFARPPFYGSLLEALQSRLHRTYYLVEIYEWGEPLGEVPKKPDIGPMGDRWPRRKRQRAALRELARERARVAKKRKKD